MYAYGFQTPPILADSLRLYSGEPLMSHKAPHGDRAAQEIGNHVLVLNGLDIGPR